MKIYLMALLGLLTSGLASAQNSARITVAAADSVKYVVSLMAERVQFHETLGVGLSETQFDNVGVFDLSAEPKGTATIQTSKPILVKMLIMPNAQSTSERGRNQLLYLVPGDDLTAQIGPNQTVNFIGKSAPYQQFLQNYFLENHYQYLPAFGFRPNQVKNEDVLRQSDSLKQVRLTQYQAFKAQNSPDATFDAFVQATTMTEPYLIKAILADREMRRNRAVKMDAKQRTALEDFTLQDFKVLPDEALISQAYRNELRNWLLIPISRKYQLDSASQNALTAEAVREAYRQSKEKLQGFPAQQQYLQTYWLNYAATALTATEVANELLADYRKTYPQSAHGKYFAQVLDAKGKLKSGSKVPNVTLLGVDSTQVPLASFEGNPVLLVFAFNLKQHEPALKALEESFHESVSFVYISVAPGIPFSLWKEYTEARPGVMHLWASEEATEELKKKYAIDTRHPFVVVDASGKIVDRWVAPEFPDNKHLQAQLNKLAGK
ncbi:hypothetical protein GCM10027275_33060 [Rhabdobacter roseus]|uniref:Peroxiredoxin n=1 Tax=Rhabdobacter roseus TaxID=1655419 RepID=A0A840TV64_9BACT|nr:hypothetical protein [Rhabdobacter roseus]MBB5285472.1 peroxiredoxin [Rhabdobacter roseus]